ncbi:MAG TPA: dihydrodipicolinate synthase family protein [Chondromyces sp.]|nr:dihydrodipicolinate synthase family protein [Chondromyces sp.]
MQLPKGAYAPIPTPLDAELRFDAEAQRTHLCWLAGEGLDGALVLGTNGEFPSLALAERRTVAEAAAAAGSGLALMLCTGSCALPEVLEMLEVAAGCGYGSVLCPPPFYFRSAPVRGLADFLLEVLDRSRLPVLLYHIPQVNGVPISDELLELIGEHPRLAGVKDSSESESERLRLSGRFADRAYLVGTDRLVEANRRAGGAGSISAAASVAPGLVAAVQRGTAEQSELDRVRALLEKYGLGPSVKAILRRSGLGDYATRPPLLGLNPEREEALWEAYCALVPVASRPVKSR